MVQTSHFPEGSRQVGTCPGSKAKLTTGQSGAGKIQEKGQSLAEILIAVSIGAIIIGSAAVGVSLLLRSNLESRSYYTASFLAREFIDKARSVAEGNWHDIYDLQKGTTSSYKFTASGTALTVASGTESSTAENTTYTRYFTVENVYRDGSGNITESGSEDPSTQKITALVRWASGAQTKEVTVNEYLTRWRNKIFPQSDWSGGSGETGVLTEPNNKFASSTNIDYTSSSGSIVIQGF